MTWTVVVPEEELAETVDLEDAPFVVVGLSANGLAEKSAIGHGDVCVAIVSWRETFAERLRRARDELRRLGQRYAPNIYLLDGERSREALQCAFAEGLASYAGILARREAELGAEVVGLRRRLDDAEQDKDVLRELVADIGIPGVEQVFAIEPGKGVFLEPDPDDASEAALTQLLPVSAANLCAIELHVPVANFVDVHPVSMRLIDTQSGAELAVWRFESSCLRMGWNRFGLTRAARSQAPSIKLEIRSRGLPPLSLGDETHVISYHVVDEGSGEVVIDRPFAMRVYAAIPGAAVVHAEPTILAEEDHATRENRKRSGAEAALEIETRS